VVHTVRKRDGQIVAFDQTRIEIAIRKAALAVGGSGSWAGQCAQEVARRLAQAFGDGHVPDVEEIQDVVEEVLIASGHGREAKAYILYREQRSRIRQARQLFTSSLKLVDEYINQQDWRVNENSNMTYSLQGLNFHVASAVAARYWLQRIYPPEVRRAHIAGDFHLHNLGILSTYCCGWDLQDLLLQGFGGVPGKIESRPPRHLRTALGQIVNFFYTLQGEAAGAQAFSNFDTLLAPFVRADNLDYRGVQQAMQEFIFNINVPTRVGFQTPFTNLSMDLTPPSSLRDAPVIIGGELQTSTYGDFQREMDMLNRAFAEIMLEGDAKGRIFTFPIPTYNIGQDFDWENPVLQPVWEMTAIYGIPYFANFVNSDMNPDDARSMCCRLRIDNRELRKRGGGLFGANPLTGSIGVVTVNLSRLGYLAENEEDFLGRLGHMMDIARTSLEIKRKALEDFAAQGLYPYSRCYLKAVHQRFGRYWANHFSTIGIIGMNEACRNLLGVSIAEEIGRDLAMKTMHFIREKLRSFQVETGNLYNLEATPAEGATYRLARADRDRYADIITAGEPERPYYTNSTHLPVDHSDDLFFVLRHQDELQSLYTGGTVLHLFLGERLTDGNQARTLVRRIVEKFKLPYFTLTPTFSICPVHGYLAGEHPTCPKLEADLSVGSGQGRPCDRVTEVYSRVVGYYRPVSNWNLAKQQEFADRKVFQVPSS